MAGCCGPLELPSHLPTLQPLESLVPQDTYDMLVRPLSCQRSSWPTRDRAARFTHSCKSPGLTLETNLVRVRAWARARARARARVRVRVRVRLGDGPDQPQDAAAQAQQRQKCGHGDYTAERDGRRLRLSLRGGFVCERWQRLRRGRGWERLGWSGGRRRRWGHPRWRKRGW